MAERLRRDPLPPQWSYGVKSDGRIFFINEETRSTTWLHPVTGKAVSAGYHERNDLPQGWQEGITREGVVYFLNHHKGTTTFNHPVTNQPEADDEFLLIDGTQDSPPYHRPKLAPLQIPQNNSHPAPSTSSSQFAPPLSPSSNPASPEYATTPNNNPTATPTSPTTPSLSDRPSFKKKTIGKGSTPSLKRRRDAVASMEGWLYKQDNSALKVWRKRWCVLADFCLFYYKGSDKTASESGSILIPSYHVTTVGPQDKITRKFAFKCGHENMRTYYFAAENQVDMNQWMRALKLASNVQLDGFQRKQQYDEDDAGFKDYRSRSQSGGRERDDDWLFKSPKEINGTDDYDNRQGAPNGFDPNGRLPREPDEMNGRYRNGDEDGRGQGTPEGYWEARERYIQNHGRYPEDAREGHDRDPGHPPAIYDYPPDEDIDGYSSAEDRKKELRERYPDEDQRLRSGSDHVVSDKEMSDREEYGMDPAHRDRSPAAYEDRRRYPSDEYDERGRFDSSDGRGYPQQGQPLSDSDPGDDYTKLLLPARADDNGDDQRRDRYNSLSESDQDRQIVPVEEQLVSSAAPMEEAGFDYQDRPRSGQHERQSSRPVMPEENRRTRKPRDSESSQTSQDKPSGRPSSKDPDRSDHRLSWDVDSGSLSSRDNGPQRSRTTGRGRKGGPAPHSPGQYPESYNTLPRPRSKSRERKNTDDSKDDTTQDRSSERRSYPQYDSSTTESIPSPSIERSAPQSLDPRDPRGTRSLDRSPRPSHPPSDSSRGPYQRATLPYDRNSPDVRRDQTDSDKLSTPTGSAPDSVDGRASLPRDQQRGPRRGPLMQDEESRRVDPRGDPRRSDPRGGQRRYDPNFDPRGDPRNRDPRRSGPRGDDPRADSFRSDSQMDPRRGSPRRADPRGDPRRSDPRQDPRRSDPRHDPRRSDPRHDPRRSDPRGDPRRYPRDDMRGEPRRDDVRRGDPRRSDPRGDPRRDPRRGEPRTRDPREDPRADPRRSDSSRGEPREDGRREMEAAQRRPPPDSLHFTFPKNEETVPDDIQEQRSFLQSPLVQPGHEPSSIEQRVDINSPMVYQKSEPEWPTSKPEAYYKARDKEGPADSDRDTPVQRAVEQDYIPQPVEASIQRSTPTNMTFAPPPQDSPSHNRHPEEQRFSNYDHPKRYGSPITEETEGTTEADIAPRRTRNGPPKRRSERNTLERNELNSGDLLAPLGETTGHKGPREPTSRFKKWQMKAQPYILLSTGIRLRLSIAAGDLLGKSHEELVLLLIQLRRDQSNLQRWLDMIDQEMALLTDPTQPPGSPSRIRARHSDSLHRRSNPNLAEEREFFGELELERDEVERELEISRPLVHLVDNLVRMGSLYGGENQMIAQEFYKDKVQKDLNYIQPKKLIEFSRRLEEEKLNRDLKGELRQIQTAEDKLLEEKLNHLHKLDKKLQEMSAHVSLLKEDKDKIEMSLDRLARQMDMHWDEPEVLAGMEDQQRRMERDLVKVRTQLAYATKELEEIAAENGKIEYEVTLLRSKLDGRHSRNARSPNESGNMRERLQMEDEVTRFQSVMDNLEKQRDQLQNQMQKLRTGPAEAQPEKISRHRHEHSPRSPKQYTVTDLDTMVSHDINASPATMATANDSASKLAPPLRRRGDSIKKAKQIKEQQVQQSPVLETVSSSTVQSSYHASPQILHPQPRYQQPPHNQMEQPRISPDRENQYYSGPSTNHWRGDAEQERARNGPIQHGRHDNSRPDKRHTIGSHSRRSKGFRPETKYHTISRTGEIIPGSPMRRTRSVPDRKGLSDDDDKRSSAMDRLLPGSPYKNTSYDPYHGAVSDTEASSAAKSTKKKSLRALDGSQIKIRSPSLRHLRSARAQTLPGRFASNEPQTPPVFDEPQMTFDLWSPPLDPYNNNSGNEGVTNSDLGERQNRRHTYSGQSFGGWNGPFKGIQDDIAIHELQKALEDPDENTEIVIPEPSGPKPSDVVRGNYKPIEVDETTGGGFLGMPAKIIIPERYIADDIEEVEFLSPEEKERHEERVDRITKMLSAHSRSEHSATPENEDQSLQEWHPNEILSTWDQAAGYPQPGELRQKVEEEKQARQEVLNMRRALAQEVKEQSRVMAVRSMMVSTGAER